jgi:hypothetical protein
VAENFGWRGGIVLIAFVVAGTTLLAQGPGEVLDRVREAARTRGGPSGPGHRRSS